jgi:xanthine/uracil permease
MSGPGRWLLCGAVSAYFTLGVVSGIAGRSADWQRTVSRIITGVAAPILLGLFATDVAGGTIVAILALIVLAHLWFERRLPPIAHGEVGSMTGSSVSPSRPTNAG